MVEATQKSRIIISIDEMKFSPELLEVVVGDTVTWVNNREKLSAYVIGLREIGMMKSPFLNPNDEYSWTFDKEGSFTYSDGIVIGVVGKVKVIS